MPFSFDLSIVATDIARSRLVPDRAVVGVIGGAPPTFAVSPPLDHLFDDLIGFEAPAEWEGVAAVADVGFHPCCRMVWLADRSGRTATVSTAARVDSTPIAAAATPMVADVVVRSLGLRTPPPADSVALLDELIWLDALVACAVAGPLDVRSALAMQPVVLRSGGVEGWEQMHASATAESSMPCRRLFTWMDTGMFSRWVFGLWPAPDDLACTLVDLVEPSVVSAVLGRCPEIRTRLLGIGTVSA
jgi:hypothetical protein